MMVEVTVKIPEDQLPAFYEWLGRWLASRSDETPASPGGADTTRKPWRPEDVEPARQVWGKLSDPAKRMFEALMAQPGRRLSAEDLAKAAGLRDHFAVAGTLAWPGKHCYAVGRRFAICWSQSEGSKYWMEPEVVQVFRQAKDSEDDR